MSTSIENENNVTVIHDSQEKQEQEILITNEPEQRIDSSHEIEETKNLGDDTTMNPDSAATTTMVNHNDEQKETVVNNTEEDTRSRKPLNSKVKYSSMPYYRSPYYTNGHPYGPAPYYYYQHPMAPMHEKPTPLMVIPTQSSSAATATGTDNQANNSATVSPQNLPPRLRQTSTNETETNGQPSSSSSQATATATSGSQPTTNGRRHRSILPRTNSNYYSPHPPPLMATPPGVLYPYQPGHIAYNIRTPDELELLALQQQFMGLPPAPVIWPHPPAYPHFPLYPMYGPPPYAYNNSSTADTNNSPLNPEAAEWVPNHTDHEPPPSSSNDHILIDDEINFPPLNNNRVEENHSDQKLPNDSSSTIDPSTTNTADKPSSSQSASPSKADSATSQDDHRNASVSSKLTTITYSNVILQTPERNAVEKPTTNTNNQPSRTNHTHAQSSNNKQRPQIRASKETNSRRRQVPSNRNNVNGMRTSLPIETPKPVQSTDDWIEVKSKKTKKFDRTTNENFSQKFSSDQVVEKVPSPPSSLSSTGENTTTTCTSEEEESPENKVVMIVENKAIPTTTTTITDYNQIIVDDIHQRLDNNERLLIIIRGCPGSGKSTLAKSLNNGYNGQILSIDEYFQDMNSNEHFFDASKLEEAHFHNRRLVSDALKRTISPIIIDNTNTTSREMRPYVAMGKEAGYDILLIEPQTPWRYKARELFKRNLHNLPLRRIKDILNHFEHDVTVQSIIDQLKSNLFLPCQSQISNSDQNQTDTESIDPILTSKKSFDIVDDSTILDDVRLCINDMILFLTSNYYQTSLSIPLADLPSVSSSSPTTPSTPHSLFYRSFSRLSSTTSNQDHSFSNEHLLRLSTSSYSRCFESLTPPSSTNSSIIGKKRRKNKNKSTTNELLLNTNNNNNTSNEDDSSFQGTRTYQVYLPEETSDYIIIDDQTLENISSRNHSSVIPSQPIKTNSTNESQDLLNIIHDQFTRPSTDQRSTISTNHVAVQCSAEDFNRGENSSERILIGRISSPTISSTPISPPPGFTERGIQVDLAESHIDSLENLIEFYVELLPVETIQQFCELCNNDIQWARTQIDEYLQHSDFVRTIPTLRQLSLNALNQWNEQIKCSNPSFDTISIADLLQDINDEEATEEFILDNNTPLTNALPQQSIQLSDAKQMTIPWSLVNSLQDLYGELPNVSTTSSTSDGLLLPMDDELSMNIYQALQRFLGVSNQVNRPVNEKKSTKKNKKQTTPPPLPSAQQQQSQTWIPPTSAAGNKQKPTGPSLKDIMDEELRSAGTEKQKPKPQLDFASQHKLKELERHFPSFPPDVLYDIFTDNESDYDLTLVCISSMLEDNPLISPLPRSQPVPLPAPSTTRSKIASKPLVECPSDSFETSRLHAHEYALKRKECFNKADQAHRHGMTGVASFYINQAREQTRLMKEANRQACESLSQIRLQQFRQTHRLDLHEFHVDEALDLFRQVEGELHGRNRRTTPKSIEIITGYGKNSPYGGGTGRIRTDILNYLRQKNYKYSEPNKGAILVQF